MPQYLITSPEGKKYRINAPDGASKEQALEYAQKQFGASSSATPPETPAPSIGRTVLDQSLQGATFGFADEPMDYLGAAIAKGSDLFRKDKLFDGKGVGDLYDEARSMSKQRLSNEMEQNPATSIASSIGGALLTGGAGASTKTGTALADSLRAGGAAARIGKGALAGAASGGLYGLGSGQDGNRMENAAQGAAFGGLVGGAIPAVGAVAGGVKDAILPKVSDPEVAALAQKALDEGIPLSRSQIGDSRFAKAISSTTKSIPFSGSKEFSEQQIAAFNKAALAKAGISGDKATPEVLSRAADDFGKRFSSLTDKTTITVGDDLLNKMAEAEAQASRRLGKDATRTVGSYIDDILASGGKIDGETYQNTRSALGKLAKTTNDTLLSKAYRDVQSALDDAAFQSLPEAGKKEWQQVRKDYSAFKTIQKAMNNSGEQAAIGNISPAQLAIAAKSGNPNYALGAGELNDLARVGSAFLKDAIPNSGSPERLAAYGTLFGAPGALLGGAPGAVMAPAAGVGLGRAFNAIDTSQPMVRRALAPAADAISPLLSVPSGAAAGAIGATERQPLNTAIQGKQTIAQQTNAEPSQPQVLPSLAEAEGNKPKAYTDTTGNRTIGIGFNMDSPNAKALWKNAGVQTPFDSAYSGKAQLSPGEVNRLAIASQLIAENDAKKLIPNFDQMSPNRREAVLHMAYQLGGPRLSEFDRTLKLINNGNYEQAANALMQSKYAKQTPDRVERIARMLAADVPYGN